MTVCAVETLLVPHLVKLERTEVSEIEGVRGGDRENYRLAGCDSCSLLTYI